MDEATRWARRGFYLAFFLGILQTAIAIATWLGWQPKLSAVPPLPPVQFFLSGLTFIALAFTWFKLKRHKPTIPADYTPFATPRWEIVSNRRFVNESILVDGKSFRSCTFTNVTFSFHGTAPTEFTGQSQFEGSIRLSTNHPPTMFWRTLEHLFSTIPGAEVETSPVDDKGLKVTRRLTTG